MQKITGQKDIQQGFIMPVLLFSILLITLLITVVTSLSLTTSNLAARDTYRVDAQLAADAGLDAGLNSINTVSNWNGSGGEVTLLNTSSIKTTYQTTLSNGATSDRKVLAVTGRTYAPASSSTPKIIRKYEVDIKAITNGNGPTSVVTGVGGLVLDGNSKITGGDVVVNGTITVNNGAQIGLSSTPLANAVNIRVAHTNCPSPVDATYPRVCLPNENGQPITVDNNGFIYADVRATNQTTSTNMFNPGLVPNQIVAPVTLPAYDRIAQKAAVTSTQGSTAAGVDCGNNQSVTWPANLKIVGDINLGNKCTVTLSGNVWITGNLIFGTNSKIVVPNSLGTTMPVIMVDGATGIDIDNNGTVQTNSSGTGVYFIAYWANATCSPDCASLTGTDLKNSQDIIRLNLGNGSSAPGSILYSRWSRVKVSNNGEIGAVAGQSIELGNNAIINFTSSVPGSDNLHVTWVKRGYMRVFN
ncbi:MAG TPA: hypothetical protein VLG25_00705 [Patescibacteria group bacterium]|nr:hypothetical protein [Patescibacteria group bacterium]